MNSDRSFAVLTRPCDVFLGMLALGCLGFGVHKALILEFPSWTSLTLLVGLPLAVAGALGVALRRARPETRIGLAVCLFTTLAASYCVEALLRWSAPDLTTQRGILAAIQAKCQSLGGTCDGRDKIEVVRDLRKERGEAYAYFFLLPGQRLENAEGPLFPLATIPQATIARCNEAGKWVIREHDEHGFNNPAGSHAWDSVEVLMVGDSFTEGDCVAREDSIAGHLRKHFPRTLNLGVGGSGPLRQLAILREYAGARPFKKLVWLFFGGNDPEDLRREMEDPVLRRYLEPGFRQDLAQRAPEIRRKLIETFETRFWREGLEEEAHPLRRTLKGWAKLHRVRSLLGLTVGKQHRDTVPPEYPGILETARAEFGLGPENTLLVYVPFYSTLRDPELDASLREAVRRTAERMQFSYLDLTPLLQKEGDILSLFPLGLPMGHFNERGYALIARHILAWLRHPGALAR